MREIWLRIRRELDGINYLDAGAASPSMVAVARTPNRNLGFNLPVRGQQRCQSQALRLRVGQP